MKSLTSVCFVSTDPAFNDDGMRNIYLPSGETETDAGSRTLPVDSM
jgi:hypothetical protein